MRKRIFLIAAFISCSSAFAVPTDEPAGMCNDGCSKGESEIWDAFQQSRLNESSELAPAVYSGACYHSGEGYDPEHAHYGMAYFSGDLYFNGEFAFFYASDPYATMTVADAAAKFPDAETESRRLIRSSLSGIADFSTDTTMWRYWFRSSADNQSLYVIAFWSVTHSVFCRLDRHPTPPSLQ